MESWAPDGLLRFANYEPAVGHPSFRALLDRLIDNWAEEEHKLLNF